MNRKEKLATAFLAIALVSSLVMVGLQQVQMGELKEKYLSEPFIDVEGQGTPLKGHLTVSVLREGETDWVLYWSEHNVITNAGRNLIRDQIGGTPSTAFDYIQVGTGSGGGAGSTDLVTPFSTRAQGTYAEPYDYNWTITYTFTAGFFGGETITEAAVFNAISGGAMLNYQDFTGIVLQAGDSLQVQFEFMVT